ncbi:hypothetical protein H0H81_012260 [Sphagnurus paluster]|uniref:Uncharacterized protein n=1 Tax=Sphagnurus paluster TaxID=117069 RepID=A0A9P7GP09_9AGAR|nr:hypothetical protein H0H81_012260 [Sphagnurus paluster]
MHQAVLLRHLISREKAAELHQRAWEHRLNMVSMFKDAVLDLGKQQEYRGQWSIQETSTMLEGLYQQASVRRVWRHMLMPQIIQQHSDDLRALVPFLEASLMQRIESMLAPLAAQSQTSLDITNQVHAQWASLGGNVGVLAQSIVRLSATAAQVVHTLDGSLAQAQVLGERQHSAGLAADRLGDVLAGLAAAAHGEVEKMANASEALIERVQNRVHVRSELALPEWVLCAVLKMLGKVVPVERLTLTLEGLARFSGVRLVLGVLGFARFLFSVACSGLTVREDTSLPILQRVANNVCDSPTPEHAHAYCPPSPLGAAGNKPPPYYNHGPYEFPSANILQAPSPSTLSVGQESFARVRRLRYPRVSRIPERLCRPMF